MIRILALDTTGECASIALIGDGEVIEEARLESTDGFAHVLFPAIEQLLARHAIAIRDIDFFAAASGPGSFTGVRVGLTAVKGLAEATGRKVIAVSNLRAVASLGSGPLRAVAIDARRGEIFGAVYDDRLRVVCGEVVMRFEDWKASLPAGVEMITPQPSITLAAAIGKIAAERIESAEDPAAIDANYVRRSDAELYWKDQVR